MSKTPEGKVKERVKAVLKAAGAYYHMPVVTGHGRPSLDFVGCHAGRFFGVETKAGSGKPTERQRLTMQEIERAGGRAFLVNDATGERELQAWLKSCLQVD